MVKLASGNVSRRKIPVTEFFLGYKKLALKPGEIITAVEIPLHKNAKNIRLYKVSQRKDLDISAVSAALMINTTKSGTIESAKIAFGGVAATPVRIPTVESYLLGKRPTTELVAGATQMLHEQLTPLSDPRGTDSFRRAIVHNIFNQYVYDVFGSGLPP
jgi:xanthine dehydrogenase iron-sulfur cluster and FAD-binding subunit A